MMGWFETLEPAAQGIIRLIALESLYVVPIFSAVGVASWFLRRRGPGLHLALWSLVLLRLVLPPNLTHPVSVGGLWANLMAPRATVEVEAGLGGAVEFFSEHSASALVPAEPRPKVPWAVVGFAVWTVGFLYVGRRMWLGKMRFRRLVRAARDPRSAELENMVEQWRRRMGIRRQVRIVVTIERVSPFTIGVARPVIVLPEVLGIRACEAAVAHEMAHVKRLDALWSDLQRFLHCLYFFHPIVWVAGSRVDLERERLCDATVLEVGEIERQSYARALVDAAGLGLELGPASAFTRPKRRVQVRVHGILFHRSSSLLGRCAAVGFVLSLGVGFIPLAGEAETSASSAVGPPSPPEVVSPAPVSESVSAPPAVSAPVPESVPAPPAAPQPPASSMVDPVPSSRVTQGWGDARNPFSGDVVFHRGLDLAAPRGTEVHAASGGVVSRTLIDYEGKASGRFVIIDHGDGLTTYYGHVDEVLVEVGDPVERGQAIATVGTTGLTTGPHIHFEVRRDGEQVDPDPFVDR